MGQPEGKAAYQTIIHPSISTPLHLQCLFLLLLLLSLLLPDVTLTIQSASGLASHHSAHMTQHHTVTQWIRRKKEKHAFHV